MLGFQEVILILAILLIVFGPSKLPEIARALGKAINEFNKASRGLAEAIQSPIESKPSKMGASIAAEKPNSGMKRKPLNQESQEKYVQNKREEPPTET